MQLKVVTPKELAVEATVDAVTLPGALGELTVLPGHTAFISSLRVGVLRYVADGANEQLATNRGFVEVLDDTVTVLTETCEESEEIDVDRAEEARRRAEERLASSQTDANIDVARAEYALRRALTRLKVAGS